MIRARSARFLAPTFALLVVSACSSGGTGVSSDSVDATPDSVSITAPEDTPSELTISTRESVATDSTSTTIEPTTIEPTTTESITIESSTTVEPTTTVEEQPYDFSAVAPIVENFVDDRGLNGAGLIIVDRDDGVIYEGYWGEFGADRISLVASSSKMITAGVLLRLDDEGLLDIDAPISDVVDWGAGNPDITTAQLLSNSSGLVGLFPNPAYGPYACQYLPVGTLQDCAASVFSSADDDGDIVAPDTEFRYGGAQWQVAGAVAEAASGKAWSQLIDEIYVQPCGLETLAFNNHFAQLGSPGFEYPAAFAGDPATLDPTDNPSMEAGAYLTTGDYAELLLMHLRGGRCGSEQVLSQQSLDRMHADRVAETFGGDAFIANTGYGMGWWVDRATGRISDAGAYGSVPWLDLEDGYGAYLVIEADVGTGNQLAALLYDIVDEAVNRS